MPGSAPREGFPASGSGVAWGISGGPRGPRTFIKVEKRTQSTTSTSQVMGPVSLMVIVVLCSVVCGTEIIGLLCVPVSGGTA